ncbi:hypothetical protein FH972_008061 [Carpinus fangiana]|uniref:Uncharacterized protein n=1 Tax=Carpinus fangiana TaxID=176857 RepID=A0A5N6R095_9ROSI|nr:hypothetical protein FH972_008061 [Carpinus fangiana]
MNFSIGFIEFFFICFILFLLFKIKKKDLHGCIPLRRFQTTPLPGEHHPATIHLSSHEQIQHREPEHPISSQRRRQQRFLSASCFDGFLHRRFTSVESHHSPPGCIFSAAILIPSASSLPSADFRRSQRCRSVANASLHRPLLVNSRRHCSRAFSDLPGSSATASTMPHLRRHLPPASPVPSTYASPAFARPSPHKQFLLSSEFC